MEMKDMFKDQGTLSKEDIERYLEGKMSAEEAHRVERYLADNPFEMEAVEGLAQTKDLEYAFVGINADIDKAAKKERAGGFNYKPLMMAASVVVIAVSAVFIWNMMDNKLEEGDMAVQQEPAKSLENNEIPMEEEAPVVTEELDDASDKVGEDNQQEFKAVDLITNATSSDQSAASGSTTITDMPMDDSEAEAEETPTAFLERSQSRAPEGQKEAPNKDRTSENIKQNVPALLEDAVADESIVTESISTGKAEKKADKAKRREADNSNDARNELDADDNFAFGGAPESTLANNQGTDNKKKSEESRKKVITIHHYDAYNYLDDYTADSWKLDAEKNLSGGVQARYRNKSAEQQATQEAEKAGEVKTVTYESVLDQALLDFDQKRYAASYEGWKLILQNYPDNVNAQFYGGLCMLYLNKPKEALELLQDAEDNDVQLFIEETLWNEALAYEKLGEDKKAQKMFQQVVDMKGFYESKARKKLAK